MTKEVLFGHFFILKRKNICQTQTVQFPQCKQLLTYSTHSFWRKERISENKSTQSQKASCFKAKRSDEPPRSVQTEEAVIPATERTGRR